MKDITGKVAFITGGASGIGLGIAKACAKYGMKVVIADSRQDALDEAMVYFKEKNLPVHPIKLDVTDRAAFAKAADEAESVFEKIHLLVNNAGVATGGPVWMMTYKDWDFGMGVNVGGTINGIVTILPRIMKHGEGGHIVATSSTGGLCAVGGVVIYNTSKYALAGMMETIATDLQDKNIGASVLVPGPTTTNLGPSTFANRPAHLINEGQEWPPKMPPPPKDGQPRPPMPDFSKIFMDPVEMGERVIRGIRRNDLFIITHPEFKDGFNIRNEAIMRACPDEPINTERYELLKKMGTLVYNPIYDKQEQVGPPDWS
ncbi:MAG: SDR family NAD(P)-dependent oxidoreductase [Dehalococcoidales bacterium]|nr:SDR family NAD(P)-dependent oxidoreductase [Dehalococcoidales bacterium]